MFAIVVSLIKEAGMGGEGKRNWLGFYRRCGDPIGLKLVTTVLRRRCRVNLLIIIHMIRIREIVARCPEYGKGRVLDPILVSHPRISI